MHMVNSARRLTCWAWLYFALDALDPWDADLGRTLWDILYVSAREIHIHIVSESVLAVTLRSPAREHSRQILPLRVGACRGWESTGLPLPLLPSGPVVSGEGDQTCWVTASPRRRGGGERSPCSFLCRIDERTAESTRPRHPATASHDPKERGKDASSQDNPKDRRRKENLNECTMQIKSQNLWMRTDVRQLHAYNRRFNRFVLDIQMFSFNDTTTSWPGSNFQKKHLDTLQNLLISDEKPSENSY